MNCNKNIEIKQGTTFSLSVDFTGTGFSLDDVEKIEFVFKKQRSKDADDIKVNVYKSDGTGDSTRVPNTNTVLVPFTETDTYLFNEGQVFYMDTKIYMTGSLQNPPTNIVPIIMSDTLFDGEVDPSIGTLEVNANGTYDAPEGHYYNRVIVDVSIEFDDINDRPKYNGVEMTSDTDIPEVPSKTSDLQNDSGYITEGDIPEIPSKTSDLVNDSGFITDADVPTQLSELSEDSTHRLVTDAEKSTWSGKQNAISDLDTIRSGAEKGSTALQPSELNAYRTSAEQDVIDSTKADKTIADTAHTGLFSKSDYRRFDNLVKASKGIVYDEEIDTEEAYSKAVPSGAQTWASLDKIGGKSVVQIGQIISAEVQSIESKKADTTVLASYPIPPEIKALDGYGWSAGSVYNEVDFVRKKFIKRVQKLELKVDDMNNNEDFPGWNNSGIKNIVGSELNKDISGAFFELGYVVSANTKNINDQLFLKRNIYNLTQSEWKTLYAGQTLHFYIPLAEPVETDISAYLTDDNYIEVEAGGTITFTQQTGVALPVPNQETYVVKVADAI